MNIGNNTTDWYEFVCNICLVQGSVMEREGERQRETDRQRERKSVCVYVCVCS